MPLRMPVVHPDVETEPNTPTQRGRVRSTKLSSRCSKVVALVFVLGFVFWALKFLYWFAVHWTTWVVRPSLGFSDLLLLFVTPLLTKPCLRTETNTRFTKSLLSFRMVIVAGHWELLLDVLSTLLSYVAPVVHREWLVYSFYVVLAIASATWGSKYASYVMIYFCTQELWSHGGSWVAWSLLYPLSILLRVVNVVSGYVGGVRIVPVFANSPSTPTSADEGSAPTSTTLLHPWLSANSDLEVFNQALMELYYTVFQLSGMVRVVLWFALYRKLKRHQERRAMLDTYSRMSRSFRSRRRAIQEGAEEASGRIWGMLNDRISQAEANPFRAKLHEDPERFLHSEQSNANLAHVAPLDIEAGEGSATTDPSAASQAPFSATHAPANLATQKSLRTQLGERAGMTSHQQKRKALEKWLRNLHGKPGLLEILFEKVRFVVDRQESKSVFVQSAERILELPPSVLKNGLSVEFEAEYGQDAGGLSAEFFNAIAEEVSGTKRVDLGRTMTFIGCGDEDSAATASSNNGGATVRQTAQTSPGDTDGVSTERTSSTGRRTVLPQANKASSEAFTHEDVCTHLSMFRTLPDGTLMLCNDPALASYHYMALGKLFGLAILLDKLVPVQLSSAMLKIIADEEITYNDVRALDPVYFKNRMLLLLQSDGVKTMHGILDMERIPFQYIDSAGTLGDALCPGGEYLFLTESNKARYVQLLSEHYLCGEVREQLQLFLSGFREIIPVEALRDCSIDRVDLGLLLSGMPAIDVKDWKTHTQSPMPCQWERPPQDKDGIATTITSDMLCEWFWGCVENMDPEYRARLLQFSTGSSRCPPGGFRHLMPRLFNLTVDMNRNHLPSAATCFNTLRLPAVWTQEELNGKLLQVCTNAEMMNSFGDT